VILSRRSFFLLLSLLVASFLLFRFRSTFKNIVRRRTTEVRIPPSFPNPFVQEGKALVGIVQGNRVREMVRESVDLIGGIDKLDLRGRTVLVKPNVVSGNAFPATTNPEVLRAVIGMIKDAGAKKVYVGDMSAILTLPTRENMEKTGLLRVSEEEGAEPLSFEDGRWVKVSLPLGNHIREAYVSEWIYRVDRIINLPVIKTHRNATYSIALKNFIGATHGRQRPYLVNPAYWEEIIAELNLAYQPHLNIADGTRVMVSGGPWSGPEEKAGVVIASGDRVAMDVVGVSLLKHYGSDRKVSDMGVWEQKQIKTAARLGIGIRNGSSLLLRDKALHGAGEDFSRMLASIRRYALEEV